MSKLKLPSKIPVYLKERLREEYLGQDTLPEIIDTARIFVREGVESSDWDGEGHDLLFFLPPSVLKKVSIYDQDEYEGTIRVDLNKCASSVRNEFINEVFFEPEDENDPEFQQAASIFDRPKTNPDTLPFWKQGYIRLFISHRDEHKRKAKKLADVLEGYGISAFVAHDTIEPMEKWQNVILNGLETMDVMLTFVTDGFHDSTWVNQEIGYALGRNVPIISLKVQKDDPRGFIGDTQALRGTIDELEESAQKIYKLLAEKLDKKSKLQSALVKAFVESPRFIEAKHRFNRMDKVVDNLSDDEVQQIVNGFKVNDQLYNSMYLTSKNQRLVKFLERTTENKYVVHGKSISIAEEDDDDIPF